MKTTYSAEKAIELISSKENYSFSLYYSKFVYRGGLNIKRAKSNFSISNLVLNKKDVEVLESFLSKKGLTAEYSITKAGTWARCQTLLSSKEMVELAKFLKSNN